MKNIKNFNLNNFFEEDFEEFAKTGAARANKVEARAKFGKSNRKIRIQHDTEKLSDKRQKSIKWF